MGRAPCCDKNKVKRGPWSLEEDTLLKNFIHLHGTGGNWISLPPKAGLNRCGKSCRLRWLNYLRPNIKHGGFTEEEDYIICTLYSTVGSRWSVIASKLSGRTDNDVKNYWNTKLKKKIMTGKISGFDNNLFFSATFSRNGGTGFGSTRFIEMEPKPEPVSTYEYGTRFVPNPQELVGQNRWEPLGMNYYNEEAGILLSSRDPSDQLMSSSRCNSSSVSVGSSSVQRVGGEDDELVPEDDIDDFWWKLLVDQSTFMGGCGISQLHENINELASLPS